jgi:parvulin-like peptidyl-prolyl isomerase
MKTAFPINGLMILFFLAALFAAGCAKNPPASEPVLPTARAQAEPKKIVVATVNGADLTMDSLITMMNTLPKKSGPPETLQERRARALDSLVLLELAYQQASTLGVNADPAKVEVALANFKENAGGDEEYAAYLIRRSISQAEFRNEIERSLTIERVYTREVLDRITIPEEELKKEYEKQKQLLIEPERVSVVDVHVTGTDKSARKKARDLLARITADTKHDPWRLVLDGTFQVRRMDVRRDREKELYEAAKKLKPRDLSGVIRTATGMHIIKLERYSPERQLTFDEAKPRMESALKPPYQEKRTQEWEQELKKGADIVIMANEETPKKETE